MGRHKLTNEAALSDLQLWCLSLSAMLIEYNNSRHDFITTHEPGSSQQRAERQGLDREWGIKTPEDLLKELKGLDRSKRADKRFEQHKQLYSSLSIMEQNLLNPDPQLKRPAERHEFVLDAYADELEHVGTDAWHDGRAVWLCRMSVTAGLISLEQAWPLIIEIATRCHDRYHSWFEFGLSYAAGYQLWKPSGFHHKDVSQVIDDLNFLLYHKESPWTRIAWETGAQIVPA